jgi:hypothetical protein
VHTVARYILKHLWWIVLLIAAVLLFCHSLGIAKITVDSTSLVLLAIILLSPFVAAIKKIKVGDFEAEIAPEEVRRIAAEAERSITKKQLEEQPLSRPINVKDAITKLAESDVVVALAKLRIELESRLRKLYENTPGLPQKVQSKFSILEMMRALTAQRVLPQEICAAIRDVMEICNRAIHGEEIRSADASRIIDVGIPLLAELDVIYRNHAVLDPLTKDVIPVKEYQRALAVRYRLTTIVPYVEKPERRIYEMTQEQLDEFFDDYSGFAEFVVRVEEIT